MSEEQQQQVAPTPMVLNRADREVSLRALEGIRLGLSATGRAFLMTPGTKTPAGEILQIRKSDAMNIIHSAFSLAEFAAEMTRQLQWLEKKTGVRAQVTPPQQTYAGVGLPADTVDVTVHDDTLFVVVMKPSTIMQGATVRTEVAALRVGTKDDEGTETTLADLEEVAAAWHLAHPKEGA